MTKFTTKKKPKDMFTYVLFVAWFGNSERCTLDCKIALAASTGLEQTDTVKRDKFK